MQIKIIAVGVLVLLLGLGLFYFQDYEIDIEKKSHATIIQQNNYIFEDKKLKDGEIIEVKFKVISNSTVNFYILDANAFLQFNKKINFFSINEKENVSSGEVKIKVKYESEWYIVFQHTNTTNEEIKIEYTIRYYYTLSNYWFVSTGWIFVVAIGVFIFFGGFIERREEEKESTPNKIKTQKTEDAKIQTRQVVEEKVAEVKKQEEKKEEARKGFFIETDCLFCNKAIKDSEKSYVCQCGCILHEDCAKKIRSCPSCRRVINIKKFLTIYL